MKNKFKKLHSQRVQKPKNDNIMTPIISSFVGIVACMLCLAGTTWAWFIISDETKPSRITASSFRVESAHLLNASGEVQTPISENVWLLETGSYTIQLTATGSVKSGGYFKITVGDAIYHTTQIFPKTADSNIVSLNLPLEIVCDAPVVASVEPCWGSVDNIESLANACEISEQNGAHYENFIQVSPTPIPQPPLSSPQPSQEPASTQDYSTIEWDIPSY